LLGSSSSSFSLYRDDSHSLKLKFMLRFKLIFDLAPATAAAVYFANLDFRLSSTYLVGFDTGFLEELVLTTGWFAGAIHSRAFFKNSRFSLKLPTLIKLL